MKNESMLTKVDSEKNYELKLMDGSIWSINPFDIPTVTIWLPTSTIQIIEKNDGNMYNYELINLNTKQSVRGMRIK